MSTVEKTGDALESFHEIGPQRAKALRALGVHSLRDLIEYFPRDYVYESEEKPIRGLSRGEIGRARGEVTAVNYISGRGRPRFEATLSSGEDRLALVFFNGAYLRRTIFPGLLLRVQGKVDIFRGIPQMVNPKWQIVEENTQTIAESRLRPRYPASAGIASEAIDRVVQANLDDALQQVDEWFEDRLLKRRRMMPRREAYRHIHQPEDREQAVAARRRLVYDELMLMQLGLALSHRLARGRLSAPIMRIDKTLDSRIRARFGFELTEAQTSAVWQIATDLKSTRPMKRLLQGDVGSGKTVVALYAMLVAVANKMQAAILAPTEVLAEQHFLTLGNMLRDSKVNIELFTGRTRRQSRGKLADRLADGTVHVAVGTQALLQENIEFANLGVVVVDEQHRLGVLQRAALGHKGTCPHYLVMTATPIPRTLALSYFADFDLTTIDQLPPGRRPIQTRWLRQSQSAEAMAFVRAQVSVGRQAYIVVPQVEDDGDNDAKSVARLMQKLSTGALSGLRLAPLHGQLSTDEKKQTMDAFRAGNIDVLVATTVIEVGIDVPNATVILVDGAERFGLSQLHQLRGRVGRGQHDSFCLLLADPNTPASELRLQTLTETTSGFDIAEMDLRLRGPGEFFGSRQHGLPEFKLADLKEEIGLLALAKDDAAEILSRDPNLKRPEHAALRAAVIDQFGDSLELARVG